MKSNLSKGKVPTFEIFSTLTLIICGFLLITPGFLTDVIGFLILLKPLRFLLYKLLKNSYLSKCQIKTFTEDDFKGKSSNNIEQDNVIDADYKEL